MHIHSQYDTVCMYIYVLVCVYIQYAVSLVVPPVDSQTLFSQLQPALFLLLPGRTLQVLSSLSSPPLLPVLSLLLLRPSSLFCFFFLSLVLLDYPLLVYPHSLHSCQPDNDWQSHLARQARVTLSLTPSSHWSLPGQRSDWVGLPASCLLSQTVISGCVL